MGYLRDMNHEHLSMSNRQVRHRQWAKEKHERTCDMGDSTGGSKVNGKRVTGEGYKQTSCEEEARRREELAQEREDRAGEQVRGRAEELAQRLAEATRS
jgi:hypothetical protein